MQDITIRLIFSMLNKSCNGEKTIVNVISFLLQTVYICSVGPRHIFEYVQTTFPLFIFWVICVLLRVANFQTLVSDLGLFFILQSFLLLFFICLKPRLLWHILSQNHQQASESSRILTLFCKKVLWLQSVIPRILNRRFRSCLP